MIEERLREIIMSRAGYIISQIKPFLSKLSAFKADNFYIAGGALTGNITDVDIFPKNESIKNITYDNTDLSIQVLAHTKNAITFKHEPWPLQLCYYFHETLKSLVDSFDYAHIQVGAEITPEFLVKEVYFTEDFVIAQATHSTWFTNSSYPLSSLIRANKYHSRQWLTRGQYMRAVLDCLHAIVKRGFSDYKDFLDQLDAVDINLKPEELKEVEKAKLMDLFALLNKEQKS